MNYWLMKSEPLVYSIDDLKRDKRTNWEGVRNYQARNFMRDSMKVGDAVLFYHSNAEPSGVAGVARVSKEGYLEAKPSWFMVDLEFVEKFKHFVSLEEIKAQTAFRSMVLVQKGSRLSVQPVEKAHFEKIQAIGHAKE